MGPTLKTLSGIRGLHSTSYLCICSITILGVDQRCSDSQGPLTAALSRNSWLRLSQPFCQMSKLKLTLRLCVCGFPVTSESLSPSLGLCFQLWALHVERSSQRGLLGPPVASLAHSSKVGRSRLGPRNVPSIQHALMSRDVECGAVLGIWAAYKSSACWGQGGGTGQGRA